MCGGGWDLPLCGEGRDQVREIAPRIAAMLSRPDAIFASPLDRARETAAIVGAALGLSIEFIDDLREWDLGEWDRRPFLAVRDQLLGGGEPQTGEPRAIFRGRVARALAETRRRAACPLLVSHGAVGLMVQELLLSDASRLRMENGTLYQFTLGGNGWGIRSVTL